MPQLLSKRVKSIDWLGLYPLAGDIGGAMGLLVGATFVSLLECCDHWIHYIFLKKRFKKRQKVHYRA